MATPKGPPPRHEETLGALAGIDPKIAAEYAETGKTPAAFVKQQMQAIANAEEREAQGRAQAIGTTPEKAAENLDDLTVAELQDRAAQHDIEGRSSMHKDELIKAVRKAERK